MSETITLYVVAASHPCLAVGAALRHKGIAFERVELWSGVAAVAQRVRFGSHTVPALRIGRQHVVGSRLIMRVLEGLQPDPPIVPRDPAWRHRVDEADRWGETVLQEEARWIVLRGIVDKPEALPSYFTGARMPIPPAPLRRPILRGYYAATSRLRGHQDRVADYMLALPSRLAHVDQLIAEGTIGREQPTVADFQIAASVRLLATLADLRPLLSNRPAHQLALRLFPDYPGHTAAGAVRVPAPTDSRTDIP